MNGFSLLPVLRGGTSEALSADRVTVHQHAHNLAVAVRQGRWKLILAIGKDDFFLARPPQLFDLEKDPQEKRNLAAEYPEEVEKLRVFAQPWIEAGVIEKGFSLEVSPEDIAHLRELGYVER